jgi:putative cardiolipin synthase
MTSPFEVQSSEFNLLRQKHFGGQEVQGSRFGAALFFAGVLIALCSCSSLPKARPEWSARQTVETQHTSWASAISAASAAHPDWSGIKLLPYGLDAFAARLALADSAERTLDLQYYIWMPDKAGKLLAQHVLGAADRGVRVRLLLDDFGGTAPDNVLLTLSAHTNIEVRIFNPVANRTFRKLSSLFDIKRVNRRMHNKSFTADRTVAIVGGRNIAEHYFGLGEEPLFADFDVIAAGPAVKEVGMMFDRFWYSESSIPVEALSRKQILAKDVAAGQTQLNLEANTITNSPQFQSVFANETARDIRRHDLSLTWGPVWLVSDLPEKVKSARADPTTHLLPQMRSVVTNTTREWLIISPYFVPGKKGVKLISSLRQRGVRIVVLSNSLASQDVTAVHAGYRRYRKALLSEGVEMWEMRPDVELRGTGEQQMTDKKHKSPGSSLHMKTLVFDRKVLFVGSLNLTPRSSSINTEMGLVMEIPALAEPVAGTFEQRLVDKAYRLELVPGSWPACGHIVWHSREDGREVVYSCEPHARFKKSLAVSIFSLLPIESEL